jgi:hypothetical protein
MLFGILVSDGSIRLNGQNALISIQQTHIELTQEIWQRFFKLKLILSGIHIINPKNKNSIFLPNSDFVLFFLFVY